MLSIDGKWVVSRMRRTTLQQNLLEERYFQDESRSSQKELKIN
jgi:hypothetical protein